MNERVEIVKAESGHDTAIYYPATQDPIFLHSNSNPVKEAKEIISKYNLEDEDVVIIYGCGMGYHIIEAYKRLSNKGKIVVVEFDDLILGASFKNKEWESLAKKENVKIITRVGNDFVLTFKNLFKEFLGLHKDYGKIKVVVHKESLKAAIEAEDDFGVKLSYVVNLNRNQPNTFVNKKVEPLTYLVSQFETVLKIMVAISPGAERLNGEDKPIIRTNKNPRVSIIIPAWNRWEYTQICLNTIFDVTDYGNYEVVVVDNGSRDYTPAGLKELLKSLDNLKVVTNKHNMGTARAKDIGVKHSSGEYLMFFDNDMYPNDPDWLRIMIETINYHPKIGACGLFGVIYLSDEDNLLQAQKIFFPEMVIPVDWCVGYCVMVRREAIVDSGGYRGDLYKLVDAEDMHLGYALRSKGWATVSIPVDLDIRGLEDGHIEDIDGISRAMINRRNMRVFELEWGPRKRLLDNSESNRTIDGLWNKEEQRFI